MCKFNPKNDSRRIDPCMENILEHIHGNVVACCCGHKRYPITIVKKMGFANNPYFLEIVSGKVIPRKKNFYKKDGDGYYYIPEVSNPKRLPTTSRRLYR